MLSVLLLLYSAAITAYCLFGRNFAVYIPWELATYKFGSEFRIWRKVENDSLHGNEAEFENNLFKPGCFPFF